MNVDDLRELKERNQFLSDNNMTAKRRHCPGYSINWETNSTSEGVYIWSTLDLSLDGFMRL